MKRLVLALVRHLAAEDAEAVAGKAIVHAARRRAERMGPNDAHELRHLWAAINAGDSDGCTDGCQLDTHLIRATFPKVWATPAVDIDEPGGGW